MNVRSGFAVGASLVLAACALASPDEDLVVTAEQAVNVCDATVAANLVVDGIPAYAQCTASSSSAIYSNNGVDTATTAVSTDWKRTQSSGGYQCTELIKRYWLFKWNVTWSPNGNAGLWCDATPPATSGIAKTTLPVHGDAIVFAPGVCGASSSTGHVALIDMVDSAAAKVTFIEQNSAGRRTAAFSCATCFLHVVANDGTPATGVGGATSVGGTTATGGTRASGGSPAAGGLTATGGTLARGGASASGGGVTRGGSSAANGGNGTESSGGAVPAGGAFVGFGGRATGGGTTSETGGNAAGGSAVTAPGGSRGDLIGGANGNGSAQNGGSASVGGASTSAAGGVNTIGTSTSMSGGSGAGSTLASAGQGTPPPTTADPDAGCSCRLPNGTGERRGLGWAVLGLALTCARLTRRARSSGA